MGWNGWETVGSLEAMGRLKKEGGLGMLRDGKPQSSEHIQQISICKTQLLLKLNYSC